MESAFLVASGLLALGFILRAKLKLFQVCYIPASVIGGIVGLVVVAVLGQIERIPQNESLALLAQFKSWPGWLIAVVFAGLFLERPARSMQENLRRAVCEGIVVWIISLGQIVIGLAVTWLVLRHVFDLPDYFGQLIEIGFVGGHGTAAAVSEVLEKSTVGYADGRDLAFFFATVGLVFSVVSGIIYINLAVRRGWTRSGDVQIPRLSGLEARKQPQPIAYARVRAEVVDPLVFQALILGAAFALGIGLQWVFGEVFRWWFKIQDTKLPLFLFTLIGGLLVREGMRVFKIIDLIDSGSIRRLTAAAMEYLIVAAIVSVRLEAVAKNWAPVTILLVLGFVWTGVCLLWLSKRLLPKGYWFELGILNYGMSTGTTAQGLMLLRIIDRDMDSGAGEDFALAAPLSAPFIGGGVITITLPLVLQHLGIGLVTTALAVLLGIFYFSGWLLARSR